MFNQSDITRDSFQLVGAQAKKGYDWWWHSFTGYHEKTGQAKAFFIEFFLCNPAYGGNEAVLGQSKANRERGKRPSYLMVNVGTWGKEKAQLHRFFAWKDVRVSPVTPYSIDAADCFCSETETRGSIHITEAEAKAGGIPVKTGKCVLGGNARTLIEDPGRSFMKVLAHSDTGEILGAQLMCLGAPDMISQISEAIANRMTPRQLLTAMRPHPTFEEALTDALTDLAAKLEK